MLVVPVYNMILAPDAALYFQMEQLKKNAGGKGIAVGEKVILIVAKKNEKAGEMTEESFYPIGAAGVLTEITSQGFAVVRTQYRVDLESVGINPDGTVKLNIHRRAEIDDLDRAVEQEKLKALKQEMRDFSAGFRWADSAKFYIDQVDSIGMAACALCDPGGGQPGKAGGDDRKDPVRFPGGGAHRQRSRQLSAEGESADVPGVRHPAADGASAEGAGRDASGECHGCAAL